MSLSSSRFYEKHRLKGSVLPTIFCELCSQESAGANAKRPPFCVLIAIDLNKKSVKIDETLLKHTGFRIFLVFAPTASLKHTLHAWTAACILSTSKPVGFSLFFRVFGLLHASCTEMAHSSRLQV